MRFRTCGLKRIQLSVTSATCVHAQQLFMLLLVATKVALPINGVKPVQAIAQEPIGNSVETLAHDKPQALHHICEAMAHGGFFSEKSCMSLAQAARGRRVSCNILERNLLC